MDETRAVAKLPHLDIEVRHAKAPDEQAEYLSISLRATPDLATAVGALDPYVLMRAWLQLNPWLAWTRLAWAPLALWGVVGPAAGPSLPPRDPGRDKA